MHIPREIFVNVQCDLVLETCFMDLSSMERLGDLSKVLNLCLELIKNINSVLLAFNVNLFAISHSLTLARSRFKTSLIVSTQLLAYRLHTLEA